MALTPWKAHVDTSLASLRILLFFVVRHAKKNRLTADRGDLARDLVLTPRERCKEPGMPVEDSFRLGGNWKDGARCWA